MSSELPRAEPIEITGDPEPDRDLSPAQWADVIDAVEPATYGEITAEIMDRLGTSASTVERAIDATLDDPDSPINEGWGEDAGAFPTIAVDAHEAVSERETAVAETIVVEVDPDVRDRERSFAAFETAIDWYHEQLDRDLPDEVAEAVGAETPREYFSDVRGWSHETISERRLGYAPPDRQGVLDALMDEGFDRDAILGTGLFYESLDPHFRGRVVLPYFDEDGRPVYAISRSIDHPADPKADQKYTKAIKTKDYSHVDEPIYGLNSVDESTDRLLVVGGIADAITLHEAGYACVSPVTTVRFKHDHEPVIEQLIEEYEIDRVYQVNDAERPSISPEEVDGCAADAISDVFTIEQYGEGLRAAFGNAEWIEDADTDAEVYLVTLPAGARHLNKLDPDKYMRENWGSIEAVLASAKPARDHAGYQAWRDNRQEHAIRAASDVGGSIPASNDGDGPGVSALYSLDITDVTGERVGFRGKSPLGHHGESEHYYVIIEPDGEPIGYDHKYKAAHNGLIALLIDADERRAR